jgi:hypothetical protein
MPQRMTGGIHALSVLDSDCRIGLANRIAQSNALRFRGRRASLCAIRGATQGRRALLCAIQQLGAVRILVERRFSPLPCAFFAPGAICARCYRRLLSTATSRSPLRPPAFSAPSCRKLILGFEGLAEARAAVLRSVPNCKYTHDEMKKGGARHGVGAPATHT